MSGPADIFAVLRHRLLAALWFASLVSLIGDWAARIALAVLVLDRTGSASLSSLVLVVSVLPWVGLGQIVATRLSHLPRVRVMVGADLARAGVYAVLLLPLPIPAILALVLVAALATPPFDAARSALTVEVVPEADYGAAITLLDMTDQAGVIIGYLAGGVWVATGGVHTAILADVVSFLVSAVVVSFVREPDVPRESKPVGHQLRDAVRVIRGEPVIRRGSASLILAAFPVAAIEATAAAYARFALHAGARTAGELAAAVPAGILLSVPFLARGGGALRLLRTSALTAMLAGLVGGVAFGGGHLVGAFVGYGAAGVLTGSATPAQIAFQPRIRREDRAGVISLLFGLLRGAEAIGAAIGGLLIAGVGARPAAIGWMVLAVVVSAAFLLRPLTVAEGGDAGGHGGTATGEETTGDLLGPDHAPVPRGTGSPPEDPEPQA